MIIHIDCNTFFASCEVAFHPELKGKPVVVSNTNEAGGGVILALTAEAKKLGLKRGLPVFQAKKLIEDNGVIMFPVDHIKYRNTSKQIMQLVIKQDIIQNFIQYSVDEFFGELPIDDETEVRHYVGLVKDLILKETDIPVSCGCSQTYTLAKVATWYSKHYNGYKGICVLSEANREKALARLSISDVWGIGRQSTKFLTQNGIATALDFTRMSEAYVRRTMKIVGLRTWQELQGIRAIEFENDTRQKSLSHSQTFAYMTDDRGKLRELVARFVSKLASKLREQDSMCQSVTVYLRTNRHRPDLKQRAAIDTRKMTAPTQDTRVIMDVALQLLDGVYLPGFMYKKLGITLTDIVPAGAVQLDLFSGGDVRKSQKLMQALDDINRRFGAETVHSALSPSTNHEESDDDEDIDDDDKS